MIKKLFICFITFGLISFSVINVIYANDNEIPEYISSPISAINEENLDFNYEEIPISTYSAIPNIGEAGNYNPGTYNFVYKNSGNLNYNCYLFAIGRTSGGYAPGNFSTNIDYATCNISTFQNAVINDLKALGYTNARLSSAS